jgi:uncharacterized protein (DUF1778 family)
MSAVSLGGSVMVKAARFELRADPEQIERWRLAADADGRSLGDWLAQVADAAAHKALGLLPKAEAGFFLTVARKTDQKMLDQFRHALVFAIKEQGACKESDAMKKILERLEHPSPRERDGHAFSPGEQELIRRAQMLAAKR